nr:Im:6908808 protein [Danio rerio]
MLFLSVLLNLVQMNSRLLIPTNTVNTCEGSVLHLNCDTGTIHITAANYGRTDKITCSAGRPFNEVQYTNCHTPSALAIVSQSCNGRKICDVSATNEVFTDPCFGTYKYLSTLYSCRLSLIRSVTACEGTNAVLKCGVGSYIQVESTNYGRTDSSTCSAGRPASQLTKTNCFSSTSDAVVADACNRKNTCTVSASNDVFGDPCYVTYKYLYITYSCGSGSARL